LLTTAVINVGCVGSVTDSWRHYYWYCCKLLVYSCLGKVLIPWKFMQSSAPIFCYLSYIISGTICCLQ